MDRKAVFAIGLAASLAALLWALGFPGFFLFLVLPFLWFPMGRRAGRNEPGFAFCPACGGRL